MFEVIGSSATVLNPQFNSALNGLLSDALQLVLLGVASLAALALNKWKASLNSGWKQALADRAVKWAEQKFVDNDEKQKNAAAFLSERLKGRVAPAEIEHLLEEAVFNMKVQLGQAQPPVQATTVVTPVSTEAKPQ